MKKIVSLILAMLLSCACLAQSLPVNVTGLWHAANGGSTLFLRDDGTGSLNFGGTDYNISWMQNGGSITLDQGGALVDGVCDESCLSLAIGGGNLIFLREVPEVLPLDADLSGEWIAPMPGGDSLLTLNADGTAVLRMGPEAVNLTWTHEGAAVTLLQEGFPIECAFDGVFISILLGEGSMCFMRPVVPEDAAR